jgi:methylmalonyl-CoA mutase cobalamin-binding subunit
MTHKEARETVRIFAGITIETHVQEWRLKRGVEDMIVVAGGAIPDEDVVALKCQRIDAVRHAPAQKMIDKLKQLVTERGQR